MSFKAGGNMGLLAVNNGTYATIPWARRVRDRARRRLWAPNWVASGQQASAAAPPLGRRPSSPLPHALQGVCDQGAEKIVSRALQGVVVGAGRLGLVPHPSKAGGGRAAGARAEEPAAGGAGAGASPDALLPGKDQDGDGIIGAFDVDDNGNMVVDNTDANQASPGGGRQGARRRREAQRWAVCSRAARPRAFCSPCLRLARPSTCFQTSRWVGGRRWGGLRQWPGINQHITNRVHPGIPLPAPDPQVDISQAANVYASNWDPAAAEARFTNALTLAIQNSPPSDSAAIAEARLNCNGLPYCSPGGTGKWLKSTFEPVAFPDGVSYDAAAGGGLMQQTEGAHDFQLLPGTTYDKIQSGDAFLATLKLTDGTVLVLPGCARRARARPRARCPRFEALHACWGPRRHRRCRRLLQLFPSPQPQCAQLCFQDNPPGAQLFGQQRPRDPSHPAAQQRHPLCAHAHRAVGLGD
jgi:hypothetical protein